MRAQGFGGHLSGENIAAGQQEAPEVVAAWVKSPGHCRNRDARRFSGAGVGVALRHASESGIYWVQNFGGCP